MRVLLLTTDEHGRNGLVRALESKGHEVIRATSRGEDLLAAAEHAGRLHGALLSQVALGQGWPRLLRQLRRRVPSLPAIILLGPEAEQNWRLAILAGAFDALPECSPEETVFLTVHKALSYSTGKPLPKQPIIVEEIGRPEAARSSRSRDRHSRPAPQEFETAA
jgi:DNA-binding NarL/FixJ family response regulator